MELGFCCNSIVELERGGLYCRRAFSRIEHGKQIELTVLVFDWLWIVGEKGRASVCSCACDQDHQEREDGWPMLRHDSSPAYGDAVLCTCPTSMPCFCGAAVPAARAGETPAPQVVFGRALCPDSIVLPLSSGKQNAIFIQSGASSTSFLSTTWIYTTHGTGPIFRKVGVSATFWTAKLRASCTVCVLQLLGVLHAAALPERMTTWSVT